MSNGEKAIWTIVGSVGFTALVLLSRMYIDFDSEGMHLVIALMPLIIWLVVSNKLQEITGPGGFGIVLAKEIKEKTEFEGDDQPVDVDLSIMRPKGGQSQLDSALRERFPISLSFRVPYDGYSDDLIRDYVNDLTQNSLLKYVVFLDHENRFAGLILPSDFSAMLSGGGVAPLIQDGTIMKRRETIVSSVTKKATNRDVLTEMDKAGVSIMPVVNEQAEFIGVVRQEDVVRRILTKVVTAAK